MANLSGGRGWLNDGPAASVARMDSQKGSLIQITEAGRTNAEQWALWNRWQAGGTYNRPPYLYQPAYPGSSPHESGAAIDSNDGWLLSNGNKNGWRRNIASDVVHWIYEAERDQYAGGSAGGGGGSAAGDLINIGAPNVARLQEQLGVEADGIPGPITISALQTRVGAIVDGEWGPDTLSRTQAFVGATVDGIWGPESHTLIVAAIDAGKFRTGSASDPDVLEAQQLLNKLGYGLVEDGVKGEKTLEAIKLFQAANGLDVDGIFGPATKAKALAVIANPKPPVEPPVTEYPTGYYRPDNAPQGSLFGIDISRYQQGFDFTKWATEAKEDFIILKRGGSNAGTYIDSQYAAFLPRARATGKLLAHYWFNGREGVANPTASAQAMLKDFDIKPGELVILDVEDEDDMPHYSVDEALEFGATIEAALGVKPILYMNASTARQQQWAKAVAAGYKLWVAMYSWLNTSPKVGTYVPNDIDPLGPWGNGDAWVIHQYTSTVYGTMPGMEKVSNPKSLDRNIAKPDTWAKYSFVKYPDPSEPVISIPAIRTEALKVLSEAQSLVDFIDGK